MLENVSLSSEYEQVLTAYLIRCRLRHDPLHWHTHIHQFGYQSRKKKKKKKKNERNAATGFFIMMFYVFKNDLKFGNLKQN